MSQLLEFDRYNDWNGGPDGTKVSLRADMVLSVSSLCEYPPKVEIQIIGGVRWVRVAEPYEVVMKRLRAAQAEEDQDG